MFYETARDCLELFMAVVPMKFADVVKTSPRMGAVFNNDCCYIAHNTTLISHTYRHDLGKTNDKLLGSVGLIDFIPRYRSLGEAVLSQHVEDQRQRLYELVCRINITTELEEVTSASDSKPRPSVRRAAGRMLVGGIQLASRIGIEALTAAAASYTNSGSSGSATSDVSTAEALPTTSVSISNGWQSSSTTSTTNTNDVECAKLVVQHVERLGQQWQGVLQEAVYSR